MTDSLVAWPVAAEVPEPEPADDDDDPAAAGPDAEPAEEEPLPAEAVGEDEPVEPPLDVPPPVTVWAAEVTVVTTEPTAPVGEGADGVEDDVGTLGTVTAGVVATGVLTDGTLSCGADPPGTVNDGPLGMTVAALPENGTATITPNTAAAMTTRLQTLLIPPSNALPVGNLL